MGVSGQLYWEGLVMGNVHFPAGVRMLIAQFSELFGSAIGAQLQQLARKNGWMLAWALGIPNFSDSYHPPAG